ncbi:hypothetical protein [uncultured Clostridium sp.]|uniref:hypothetical protein n=1 Tax=uncultured Clostridium sp. TaxID=59620 RepID=UPI0026EBFBE6|nr:hypothetical protein [uncultured Clostridium sp.]
MYQRKKYIRKNPIMTSNTTPEGEVFSSPLLAPTALPYYSFRESSSSLEVECWVSNSVQSYIGYKFTKPTIVNVYKLQPRLYNDSNTLRGMPNTWTFEGSNDMSNWTVLDTQSGISFSNVNDLKTFEFTNNSPYLAYRLNITQGNGTPQNIIVLGHCEFGQLTPLNSTFIKYKPTYFVGSINGKEDVVELLDGTLEGDFTHGSRHSFDLTKTKSLKQSIQDFDYIDVETRIYYEHDATSKGFYGNQITRVPVKDIILYQSGSLSWLNTWQVTSMDMHLFGMLFGFKDNNTIYIYRVSSSPNTNSGNEVDYKYYQICSVKGIRTNYSVGNKTV